MFLYLHCLLLEKIMLDGIELRMDLHFVIRALANFSMTFAIVSILTGLTTLYGTGLTYGGPATMVYGWLLVGCFTMMVGMAMAEICSAYPTSGGLYFWSGRLCGNEWGPFASWLTGWYVPPPLFLSPYYVLCVI